MRTALIQHQRSKFGLAFVFSVLLAVTFQLSPAGAHDTLLGSNPADGSEVVQTELTEITLQYSAQLLELGNAAVVTDSAGNELFNGELQPSGDTITIKLDGVPEVGELTANWRVVSSDGHPIEGTLTFQITEDPNYQLEQEQQAAATETEAAREATSDAGGSEDASSSETTTDEENTAEAQTTSEAQTNSEAKNSGISPIATIGIALAVILGAGGVFYFSTKNKVGK